MDRSVCPLKQHLLLMQFIGLAIPNLVVYVLYSRSHMFLTTEQGNKCWLLASSAERGWSSLSASSNCAFGFCVGRNCRYCVRLLLFRPSVLFAGLIWKREFCSWSLLHAVGLPKTEVHLMSAVEHNGFISRCFPSVHQCCGLTKPKRGTHLGGDYFMIWNSGGRRKGERQLKPLRGTILLL